MSRIRADCILTHWGQVTHICARILTNIGLDNGLSPGRRQAIIWTNAGILLIRTLGTNVCEILSEIHTHSFKKIHLKMSSLKWRPFLSRSQCINDSKSTLRMTNLASSYSPDWAVSPHSTTRAPKKHWTKSRRVPMSLTRTPLLTPPTRRKTSSGNCSPKIPSKSNFGLDLIV